jgi:hypothetical protein
MSAGTAPAPPQRAFAATEAIQRQTGGGGTDYGEVSLDGGGGGDGEVALDGPARGAPGPAATARSEDDMEFGAVPQEAAPGATAQAQVGGPQAKLAAQKPRRRLGLQLLVGAFVLGLGGAALALVPAVGPFGAFFVMDHLKAGEYHALVGSTAKAANAALAQDSYPDAARAAQIVANAQLSARRAKGLAALAAYVGFVSELRQGSIPGKHSIYYNDRENCPGPDIWFNVAEWAITNLGLSDGGKDYALADGDPIPPEWRKARA